MVTPTSSRHSRSGSQSEICPSHMQQQAALPPTTNGAVRAAPDATHRTWHPWPGPTPSRQFGRTEMGRRRGLWWWPWPPPRCAANIGAQFLRRLVASRPDDSGRAGARTSAFGRRSGRQRPDDPLPWPSGSKFGREAVPRATLRDRRNQAAPGRWRHWRHGRRGRCLPADRTPSSAPTTGSPGGGASPWPPTWPSPYGRRSPCSAPWSPVRSVVFVLAPWPWPTDVAVGGDPRPWLASTKIHLRLLAAVAATWWPRRDHHHPASSPPVSGGPTCWPPWWSGTASCGAGVEPPLAGALRRIASCPWRIRTTPGPGLEGRGTDDTLQLPRRWCCPCSCWPTPRRGGDRHPGGLAVLGRHLGSLGHRVGPHAGENGGHHARRRAVGAAGRLQPPRAHHLAASGFGVSLLCGMGIRVRAPALRPCRVHHPDPVRRGPTRPAPGHSGRCRPRRRRPARGPATATRVVPNSPTRPRSRYGPGGERRRAGAERSGSTERRLNRMRTRLTELLGIEHPVMLAGMGGVSYSDLVTAVSEAGGFGCLGASTMGNEKMEAEISAVRQATDKPFGVDLLTAMPGGMSEQVQIIIEGGATAFVAGLGVPTEVVDQCHHAQRPGRQHVRQGRSRRARRRGRVRPRRGPRHRSRRPHRSSGVPPPHPPDCRRRGRPRCPWWLPEASSTVAAWRRRWRSEPTASGSALASSPPPRPVMSLGYKEKLLASREDETTVSRAHSGKTMRGWCATDTPTISTQHPERARSSPPSSWGSPAARRPMHPRRRLLHRRRRRGQGVLPRRPGGGRHHRTGPGGRTGPPLRGRAPGRPSSIGSQPALIAA